MCLIAVWMSIFLICSKLGVVALFYSNFTCFSLEKSCCLFLNLRQLLLQQHGPRRKLWIVWHLNVEEIDHHGYLIPKLTDELMVGYLAYYHQYYSFKVTDVREVEETIGGDMTVNERMALSGHKSEATYDHYTRRGEINKWRVVNIRAKWIAGYKKKQNDPDIEHSSVFKKQNSSVFEQQQQQLCPIVPPVIPPLKEKKANVPLDMTLV